MSWSLAMAPTETNTCSYKNVYIFNGFIEIFNGNLIRKPTKPPNWNHYKSVMETIAVMETSTNHKKPLQPKKDTIHTITDV